MSNSSHLDTALLVVRQAVQRAIAHLAEEPRQYRVQASKWGPAEVLGHLVYWHRVNLECIESVASGGEPYRVDPGTTIDDLNASALGEMAGSTIAELLPDLTGLQSRIEESSTALQDPTVIVRVQRDGSERSLGQLLNVLAVHIGEHLAELQAARTDSTVDGTDASTP